MSKEKTTKEQEELVFAILRDEIIKNARTSFYSFCQALDPEFYSASKWHLKLYCDTLQIIHYQCCGKGALYDENGNIRELLDENNEPYKWIIISIAPRHGKTWTLVLFCMWALGINPKERILTVSYNDETAAEFSRYTRDGIDTKKSRPHEIDYSDIFPDSKISKGHSSFQEWALEGQFFSYKGAGLQGGVTGKGASLQIADDVIKNDEIGRNKYQLKLIFNFLRSTFTTRREKNCMRVLNMTRWNVDDPVGCTFKTPNAHKWYYFCLPVEDEDGNMLCEEILDREALEDLKAEMPNDTFLANYYQQPFDEEGRLYKHLQTWDDIPRDVNNLPCFDRIINYTDSADEGKDYLVSITAGEYKKMLYVLDILCTQDDVTKTEKQLARMLSSNSVTGKPVDYALCESNNGGKGYIRAVEKICREDIDNFHTRFDWKFESSNKIARIRNSANIVQNLIRFMPNVEILHKKFWDLVNGFQLDGKGQVDDPVDCLTGLAKMVEDSKIINMREVSVLNKFRTKVRFR